MKIRISDNELTLQNCQHADCRMLIASGSSPFSEIGSVGTNWVQVLKKQGFPIDSLAWDLAVIAAGAVAADQAVQRSQSPDGWTRVIDLDVDVLNPQVWIRVSPLLTKALGFLTGDHWHLTFTEGLSVRPQPDSPKGLHHDCVSLLSGGLDSLIGAIDLKSQNLQPYFVSQTARGDSKNQVYYARMISGNSHSHFQFGETVHLPKGMRADTSHRSRSILFLAMGVVAACGTAKYAVLKNSQKIPLIVPENGFISVNVPLTPTRLGSHSTKTTHPYFMKMIQTVLDEVGLKVELRNPYQWKTKAEMIKNCRNRKMLNRLIFTSTSCGRYARTYTHCGRCVPCIIRRASIDACYRTDKTEYRFEDLGRDDRHHAKFSDVLGVKMAIARAKKIGVERWAGSSISTVLIPDVPSCVSMLDKSMAELGRFFRKFY